MTLKIIKIPVLFLIAFHILSCESKKDAGQTQIRGQCYERMTTGNGITDRLTLDVKFSEDSIHGDLLWLPQEKDSQLGIVKGVQLADSIFDVRYDYTGEGISASEKQSIIFENGRAIITRKGDSNSIDTLMLVTCRDN